MLTLLTGNALCPCCVFGMSRSSSRTPAFSCEAIPATSYPASASREAAPAWAGDVRLDGGTVIDPRDGRMTANASILVRGGRIVAVDQGGSVKSDTSVQRIDVSGKYVVPGYNDMHSHVLELDEPAGALALMLAEGVTGFRQMSGSPERLAQRRSGALPIGAQTPALLETPGAVLTPLNAATPERAAEEVRAQKAQGADFIKVGFVSPEVFTAAMQEADRQGLPILGHLQEGVDAAAAVEAGFKSIEHLGPGSTVWIACSSVEAELKAETVPTRLPPLPLNIGFVRKLILKRLQKMLINPAAFVKPAYTARLSRAIESFDPAKFEALAALFVERGVWHCPTLVRLRTQQLADAAEYAEHADLRYMPTPSIHAWRQVTDRFRKLPEGMRRIFREAYPRQLDLTKRLDDSGVRMIVGTDGGLLAAPGLTLKAEFAELAKAGLKPLKILQMATINAAEYLDRTDVMGAVQPGYEANLVVLNSNPLDRVENLHDIAAVVRDGIYHSRQLLDDLTRRVAETRGSLNPSSTASPATRS